MNIKTEKIKNLSKGLHIFALIGGIALIVSSVVFIYLCFNPLQQGNITLNYGFSSTTLPIEFTPEEFRVIFVPLTITCAYMSVIFFIVASIFKKLSLDSTPFSIKRVKDLKLIALLAIPFNLALTAVLFCFAYIFEYGIALQKQADETL